MRRRTRRLVHGVVPIFHARIFQTILGNFLAAPGWEDEVKALANGVVDSTIEIYNTILRDLRPTPAKSALPVQPERHLESVSRCFDGPAGQIQDRCILHKIIYARKPAHFRRSTDQPRGSCWFDELLLKCTREHCGFDSVEKCVIADFMVPGADPRIYEEVTDMSQLQPTIEEYLNDYNAESKQPMPLVTVWKSASASLFASRCTRQFFS